MYSGPGTDGLWFTDDDVTTDQPACEFLFTGRQYDPETQIYFYRARYYQPRLGRFGSRDSLGYIDGPNLYSDLSCNPPINMDAYGTCHCFSVLAWPAVPPTRAQVYSRDLVGIDVVGKCLHDYCPELCFRSTCTDTYWFEARVWRKGINPQPPGPIGPSGEYWVNTMIDGKFGCPGL
jgi:RHS repeat-associated protein